MFENGKLREVTNKRRGTRKERVQGRINYSVRSHKRNIKNHNCRCKPQTRRRGIQKTKGCQCLNVTLGDKKINIVYGLDSNFEPFENRIKRVEKKCQTQQTTLTKAMSCTSEKTENEGSLGYPETSIASLSSYRSLSSTNPEPML